MQDTERLLASVENYLAQQELPSEPEKLYAPIGYSLSGGGKRLRPMLLMLTCGIFSDRPERAMPAAAAVEVFHNFTLLHDDIMDNAAMRRGKPSVAARWGRNVAILSGDAMLIWAYRLLGQVEPALLPRILAEFNEMAIGVCEGQQYDMDYEERQKVSVVEYMRMIELKTSVLLGGAVVIGALLGGATAEDCARMRKFAIELGLAFQLQDDLLDSYGDERFPYPSPKSRIRAPGQAHRRRHPRRQADLPHDYGHEPRLGGGSRGAAAHPHGPRAGPRGEDRPRESRIRQIRHSPTHGTANFAPLRTGAGPARHPHRRTRTHRHAATLRREPHGTQTLI